MNQNSPAPAKSPTIMELAEQLKTVRTKDRYFLKRELDKLALMIKKEQECKSELLKFSKKVERASERSLYKIASDIKISYPEELPVSAHRQEILTALKEHQVIIVCGSTGSGKTTQLPKLALELGCGRFGAIGCTQPRRLAATAMARRVASELDCQLGEEVGYKVRFDDKTSSSTVVKFMTDGMLLSETASDAKLLNYDAIIIDEVHERSLNIDFLLGYLKNLIGKRRDLKIIISSATLNAQHFSEFFNNAPVVTVEGRTFPVEDLFLPPLDEDEELSSHIARAVEFIGDLDALGDILIFLPGEREIRDATDVLTGRRYKNTEVLPLFARLSMSDQQKIFSPGRARRIILATNVAETSVTIPRIHYVIDSGLARISRYNAKSGIQELRIEHISQASARQRRGRCGRLSDGICVYLYDELDLENAPAYTDPEIKRTSLAGVILQMATLKLGNIEHFPFVDPPPTNLIREGRRTLSDIGAIDSHHHLTKAGWRIASIPVDPHFAKMMISAEKSGVFYECCIVVAFISILDPRERPQEKQQAADEAHAKWRDKESDFVTILNLWNFLQDNAKSRTELRKLAKKNFLNYNRLSEWRNLTDDLLEATQESNWKLPEDTKGRTGVFSTDALHQALLSGVPRNLGWYDAERNNYLGTSARRFQLFPGSGLAKLKPVPKWVMTMALVETTKVFARQNALIKPEFLELVAPHLCTKAYDQVEFNESNGFVYARERVLSGGLTIHAGRRVHYGNLHPVEARKIFIQEALVEGRIRSKHPQIKAHLKELDALKKLESKLRRPDSILDPTAIYEELLLKLPTEAFSTKNLETILSKNKLLPLKRETMMQYQFTPINFDDYPDFLMVSGEKFPLEYTFDGDSPADGIAIKVYKSELNILSPAQLEYLVSGYLVEKVELMFRKLPKSRRMQLKPINEAIELYMMEFKANRVPTDLPLAETLADFLCENYDRTFSPAEFDHIEFPEYLQMKIAEMDERGNVVAYHYKVPHNPDAGSRVSSRLARNYAIAPTQSWPGGELPESMPLPDNPEITAYPAIFAEGDGVGRQLYLREEEAKMRHRIGIIQLFKQQNLEQLKFVVKHSRYSNKVKLSLFYHDIQQLYKDDFGHLIIERSLGGELWEIRSPEEYSKRAEQAKMVLGEQATELMNELENLALATDRLSELIHKVAKRSPDGIADIREQLKFLFRAGFLRSSSLLKGYPRYLRGIQLRLERLNSSPAKDSEKMESISYLIERFRVAFGSVDELSRYPQLLEFAILLEELRLTRFATEVRPAKKVSINSVTDFWNQIRI